MDCLVLHTEPILHDVAVRIRSRSPEHQVVQQSGHAAIGAMACGTSSQMLALATAAREWWESSRPEGWSLEQHLATPAAGCSASAQERALAEAVAQWVKQGR
jgi:hypothetical protein